MSADWPAGVGRLVLDEVDSTNAEAARRIEDGPAWIMARRQTSARGRRGRPWRMPAGNFAASYVFQPAGSPAQAALYSFVASLALHDVLSGLTNRELTLKWPNDVLLSGGKVAGILLESIGRRGMVERLVIGFGVNVASAPRPEDVEAGAVVPIALGQEMPPEHFLDRLAPAFAARDAAFRKVGFGPLREAWLINAARLGEEIIARTGDCVRTGRFETVDESGALVLATQGGRQSISAADVYF